MGCDTARAKPSIHFMDSRGVCISGSLLISKSMEMVFRTEQSIRIIIDGHIQGCLQGGVPLNYVYTLSKINDKLIVVSYKRPIQVHFMYATSY